MATELEIKYAVDGLQRMDRIFCDDLLCARLTERYRYIQMESTYFDTEDKALSSRRITLRLRKENDRSVITVKTPGQGYARGEWEVEGDNVSEAIPALVAAGAPAELADLLQDQDPLPVCGAKFVRIAALLQLSDGTICEVCGDMGDLYAGGSQKALCELEFELKSGSAETMLAFAGELASAYGLPEEKRSKQARARALL